MSIFFKLYAHTQNVNKNRNARLSQDNLDDDTESYFLRQAPPQPQKTLYNCSNRPSSMSKLIWQNWCSAHLTASGKVLLYSPTLTESFNHDIMLYVVRSVPCHTCNHTEQ